MSFNIGLSGLYAANKHLDVTGNNIANVATTGFKSSRTEFEDVYSATRLGSGSKTVGNGVRLANVSQQFGQGDVNRSEEQTSELQSLMRISSADFCLKQKSILTTRDQNKTTIYI